MATNKNPTGNTGLSVNFLPKFYQTPANKKFLQATLDQLWQPGTVQKVNGYIGKKNAKSADGSDVYIEAADSSRQNYQLEPGIVVEDSIGNTTFFKDYIDYINQLGTFGANVSNHARLNKQEFYSWDPHIEWDKFVNFQNYYWIPYGPETIIVPGQHKDIASTYTVSIESEINNNEYLFVPNGFTRNPVLRLYRGQTYTFEINSPGNPFSFKTDRALGTENRYIIDTIDNYGVEVGTVTFTVPLDAPTILYYQSETDLNLGGAIEVLSITENTFIDVTSELLGKKNYTLPDGTILSNGMKLAFIGKVIPEEYATGEYYVEGVGVAIRLVPTRILEIINPYTVEKSVPFDSDKFDTQPFSDSTGYAGQADYIVINRASNDRNNWSRYNRWFHKDVISASAKYNGNVASLDQTARAVRPIIEFEANLKLFNFGTTATADVDLIDDFTTDALSIIEGSFGYNVDGVQLAQGQRIIFTADPDPYVKNKIFQVQFVDVLHYNEGSRQIHLAEISEPALHQVALIRSGSKNQGKAYWYDGNSWVSGQQKLTVNQAPLFDVVDNNGISFGDTSVYNGSTFRGTKMFSYKVGSGYTDTSLGFALSYRNISNIGDIVFNFNLATDSFQYKQTTSLVTELVNTGYLSSQTYAGNTIYKNGWQTSVISNTQAAVRIYKNSTLTNNFDLDIFDDITNLSDLVVKLYINGHRVDPSLWTIVDTPSYKKIVLHTAMGLDDVLTIRAFASQPINKNGYYEIPLNLQNNPLNNVMGDFTLGEVIDHVGSIVDNLSLFAGTFPGPGNLRDLGNITPYGTRFVQHSGPLSLALYHITSESNNVIRSIEQARDDYNNFKRNFIKIAESLGVDGDPVALVDLILQKLNKDKPTTSPYYFSDMVPYGAAIKTNLTVVDYRIKTYPLSNVFTLDALSNKAVSIYLNGVQLVYGQDYTFSSRGFAVIDPRVNMQTGDTITTYEYDSTDGCYVAATPTKLGIWPKYVPKIYLDTTLVTPRMMIQGHDGSQVLAYGDYRDALILELEKRIFNNIKVEYDSTIFDISDITPGYNKTNDYSRDEFNQVLAPNFYKWTSLAGRDFTKPLSYDLNNPFTYNYSLAGAPDGTTLPGYWRGVYRYLLGTDRPNLCPWEMLGFTIEPDWWQEVYGPGPYTGDNLPMWQDITDGMLRQPNVPPVKLHKYAKPFLMKHIPVDGNGLLRSPAECGLASGIINSSVDNNFIFGDVSPVESAWRRSSHYPFSVIIASTLLTPAKTFGLILDRSRVVRNLAGQLVYSKTNLRVRPADVTLPSIYSSKVRVQTAGLINYIVDHILNFIFSNNVKSYNTYVEDLGTMTAQLSYRVGAFTSNDQFNLLLDSKTPMSTGNVFVPKENFKVTLNTSSPVKKITYSGVIITKLHEGYSVTGYSRTQPYFKYYPYLKSGIKINIGGISESYSVWVAGEQYIAGTIVQYGNSFYRVLTTTTSDNFDTANYVLLPSLPIIGGAEAILRKDHDRDEIIDVPYGTTFFKIQEVVDFLQGYGEYLKDQGFIFDEFNSNLNSVSNWDTSVKEFLFWTTQNWSAGQDKWKDWTPNETVDYGSVVRYNGDYYSAIYNISASDIFDPLKYSRLDGLSEVGSSIISLSPSASKLTFTTPMAVVDNISNRFYDYELVKVDGTPLSPLFLNSYREGNIVSYSPRTSDGIYGATFYLIQTEQVITLSNTTIFNDVIYNPESGYRQERIKVSGYTSIDWYGGLDVPGFIYDQAIIKSWQPWKDYALGDIVNYQGFYYSATTALPGTEAFNASSWTVLENKPTPQLIPNWTYKASQFEDFYNLDSDNFDSAQQKVAHHLIGYQKRQYLDNIIQDDVSEFKFYQGMIREKGTQNSLNKLFDVLSSEDKDSLTFYEEWAIRLGQYGAARAFDNIEFILDESLFRTNPQGFQLTNKSYKPLLDTFIIQQTPNDVYLSPLGYNSKPWPVLSTYKNYLRDAGYVNASDVSVNLGYLSEIVNHDVNTFFEGMYVWVNFEGPSWNVYRYTNIHLDISDVSLNISTKVMTITSENIVNVTVGSYVGVSQVSSIAGFYQVTDVNLNSFTVQTSIANFPDPFTESDRLVVYALVSQRTGSVDSIDTVLTNNLKNNELIWTDDSGNGKWAAWKYNPVYEISNINNSAPQNQLKFGSSLAINSQGNIAAIGSSFGAITIYDKIGKSVSWVQRQSLNAPYIAPDEIFLTVGTTTNNSNIVSMSSASNDMIGGIISGRGIYANTLVIGAVPGVSITLGRTASATSTNSTYTISVNQNPVNKIATSLAISFDGTWMVAGSPLAGYAVTNYLGMYNSALIYGPGVIIAMLENNVPVYYRALLVTPINTPPALNSGGHWSLTNQIYWEPIYYVPIDSFGTWDKTVIYPTGALVVYQRKVYSASPTSNNAIFGQVTFTVTNTSGASYLLTTADTSVLCPGYEINFSGTTFGGIVAGLIYYVSTIVDSTHFTLTATQGSSNFVPLTNASGLMTATQKAQEPPGGNQEWTEETGITSNIGVAGQGAISLYKKDANNIYTLVDSLISPAYAIDENFGSNFAFGNNVLYITAPGYDNNTGKVYKLKYSEKPQTQSAYNPVGSSAGILVVTSTVGVRVGMYVMGAGFTSGQTVTKVVNATTLYLSGSPDSTPSGTLTFAVIGWGYDLVDDYVGETSGDMFGSNITLSSDLSTLAVTSIAGVYIYKKNSNGNFVQTQLIEGTDDGFGIGLAISNTGTYLAISDDKTSSGAIAQQGSVTVYELVDGQYVYEPDAEIPKGQQLVTRLPEINGQFGRKLAFMNDYTTLVVHSQYGDTTITTTYDKDETTFDKNSTQFTVKQVNGGRIDIYDRYAKNWIFSESLTKVNPVVKAGAFVRGNRYAILSLGTTDFTAIGAGWVTAGNFVPDTVYKITNLDPDTDFTAIGASANKIGVVFTAVAAGSGLGQAIPINFQQVVGIEFVASADGEGTGTAAIVTNQAAAPDGYGDGFAVGADHILIGAPEGVDQGLQSGRVYNYGKPSNKFTWTIKHSEIDKPDVKKIKKAFLYNRVTGELITYIDIIDPLQGKIAGPADEEIKYKAFYDPAAYNSIDGILNTNSTAAWTSDQVGMLWWDMRTAKFINAYSNDPVYRNTNWTTLATGASIDVYEWVSTKYKPGDWDNIADTPSGIALGISGTSLYGNSKYSVKTTFNTVTQSKIYTYYFWVKNKKFVPNVEGRHLSAQDVSMLIGNPRGQGYTYLALTGLDSFSLVNGKSLLKDKEVVLSVEYWTGLKTDQNIHGHWKIISNDPTTYIPLSIEQKWIDSLCGKDSSGRLVPDPSLSPKLKYGVENRPRQGMFVNRFEALKEFVELANSILIKNQIAENRDLSKLESYDIAPTVISGLYDTIFDTEAELNYANVGSFTRAVITPVDPADGVINDVIIVNAGKGYLVAPYITVVGSGTGAVIRTKINAKGQITGVDIISGGQGYDSSTKFSIRDYCALVRSDSNANGNWSIYSYDSLNKLWSRISTQSYDVRKYWNYADWYANGYSQFTVADFSVATLSDLSTINPVIGEIVKVRTVNTGGEMMLYKYANSTSIDWTQSYTVVGIQNGTIQLSSSLYQTANTSLGFDNSIYDAEGFDLVAATELRIILDSLKNDLFISTLAGSYLDLFFASVRYAHSEQPYIDWIFKTSFVKARHNLGMLDEPVTYKPDNLSNFEDYVNEVKPYKTKVREYVSGYESLDTAQLPITDFDLQPVYEKDRIGVVDVRVFDGKIISDDPAIQTYPWKFWLDAVGFEIIELKLTSGGSGYIFEPQVIITSDSGTGATARAFIANGVVNRIVLKTSGKGFLSAPTVTIDGGLAVDGTPATAVAIIGNSVIRSVHLGMKFDRIDQRYYITQLQKVEEFTGSGSRVQFPLSWGPDARIGQSTVTINNILALKDSYILNIVSSTAKGYTTYSGTITFTTAPKKGAKISVTYNIDESLLSSADRIAYYYNPTTGQLGKDLAQLMTGIDYGGVIVNGLGFEQNNGWDSLPYYTDKWGVADETFTDFNVVVPAPVVMADSTIVGFTLTVGTVTSGKIYVGMSLTGSGITSGTYISDNVSGSRNGSVWTVNTYQVVASTTITGTINNHKFVLPYTPTANTQLTIYKVQTAPANPLRLDDPNFNVKPFMDQILSAWVYDGLFESNFETIQVGRALKYVISNNSYNKQEVLVSLKTLYDGFLTVDDFTPVNGIVTSVLYPALRNMVLTGTIPNPPAFTETTASTSGELSARTLLIDNIPFIQAEVIAYATINYSGAIAEINQFKVDIQNIVYSYVYDFMYNGNSQSSYMGLQYWSNPTILNASPANALGAIVGHINTLAQDIITNTVITRLQTSVFQITEPSLENGDEVSATLDTLSTVLTSILTSVIDPTDTITVTMPDGTLNNGTLTPEIVSSGIASIIPPYNAGAIVNTFLANGTVNTYYLPTSYLITGGNEFIIRQITSDGSTKPQDIDYDTALSGGGTEVNLGGTYSTATGLSADDIIVDGDDFVTPTSSPAPEEVVPGQVVDTVAIKVFDKPSSGSATIKVDNYVSDGETATFALTQQPNGPGAVIVKINNQIQTITTDYTLDYRNNQVTFEVIPNANQEISLFSIGFNGSNILDIDYFIGDGVTREFIANTSWQSPVTSLVYVDGQVANVQLFKTDSTYEFTNSIGIRLPTAPAEGALINFIIVNGTEQTFAITKVETINPTGSYTYTLKNAVGNALPNESNMIVRVDQDIIPSANNSYFVIGKNRLNYTIDPTKFVPYSVNINNIVVLIGDMTLKLGTDYIVDLGGVTVKITKKVYTANAGKQMIVSITTDEAYTYNPATNEITFAEAYDNTHTIQVISSYRHDILDIERTAINVSSSATLVPNSAEYYVYQNLSGGIIKLDRSVINDYYVWIVKNTTLLTPNIDYRLNDDHRSITLDRALELSDQITVITYGSNVLTPGIAYMQFKDMLNRVTYKRLSVNKQSRLTQDLHWNDVKIVLEDASNFDLPNPEQNKPGIIEIRGERIEYFAKGPTAEHPEYTVNTLSRLRRGTLGTGVYSLNLAGAIVQDIGVGETIPYKDNQIINQVISDGSGTVVLDFTPASADEIEVFVGGYNDGSIWAPGADYDIHTIVNVGSYTYRCISSHTSSDNFFNDSSKWKFFIGNIRLKKVGYSVFNINNAPHSPEGDVSFDPDFTVDGETSAITLTNFLPSGTNVTVVKNQGFEWDNKTNVLYDTGKISEFLRATPGIWYKPYKQ